MLALWCFELPGGDPARTDIPAALLCTLWVLGANPSPCFEFPPTTLPGWGEGGRRARLCPGRASVSVSAGGVRRDLLLKPPAARLPRRTR